MLAAASKSSRRFVLKIFPNHAKTALHRDSARHVLRKIDPRQTFSLTTIDDLSVIMTSSR